MSSKIPDPLSIINNIINKKQVIFIKWAAEQSLSVGVLLRMLRYLEQDSGV